MPLPDIGIVGPGVMGSSLAQNPTAREWRQLLNGNGKSGDKC